jgi:hypothetical protein
MKVLDLIIRATMYLSTVRLAHISIFFILFGLISCNRNSKSIISADIYSLNWSMTTTRDLDAEDVLNWSGDELRKFTIEDKVVLEFIAKRLDLLKPLPEYENSIDTRLVCVLNYSDGTKDQLQFGGTKLVYYNGVVYDKDSLLSQKIEDVYTKDRTRVSFVIRRTISDKENEYAYQVEITQGDHLIATREDLINQLKNTEPGRAGITDVQKVSSTIWTVKTKGP